MSQLGTRLLLIAAPCAIAFSGVELISNLVLAFSSGGGAGVFDDQGNPILQWCDAIHVCEPVCPMGMTAVAAPERSAVYEFATARAGKTSYEPGELIPFELRLTERYIVGKRDAGATLVGNESAKYLGLLLYAVDYR